MRRASLHLFVFGTLMVSDIRAAVMGARWRSAGCQARLHGFTRLHVAGAAYPALKRRSGASVVGLLLPAPDPKTLARLDLHEGPEYQRRLVTVATGGRLQRAECYLTAPGVALTPEPWAINARWRRRQACYRRRQLCAGSSRTTA